MSTIPVGRVSLGQDRYQQRARDAQMQAYAVMRQAVATNVPRKETTMLEKLRNLAPAGDGASAVDALVELAAYGRSLAAEYASQGVPEPKWLGRSLRLLSQEIKTRWRTESEAQLRKAEAELEELRSREEKRAAKEEEIARLREGLGTEVKNG